MTLSHEKESQNMRTRTPVDSFGAQVEMAPNAIAFIFADESVSVHPRSIRDSTRTPRSTLTAPAWALSLCQISTASGDAQASAAAVPTN
jgi:hypothetical protein